MAVAKSYKSYTICGEPYEKNGKMYIVIAHPNTGNRREARWYTDAEYAKMYGEKVDKFDIYIRAIVDDEYQYYSTHTWDEKTATISIDDNAYYIQLVGHNGSGESFEVEVDVNTPLAIKSDVTISLNEKIYDIDVDYTSAYRFEVSLQNLTLLNK